MRWLSFVCIAWLASLVCGNLLATGVSIPLSLQRTAVGQRVVEIYGRVIGQEIGFSLLFNGTRHWFTGKIAGVTLPDIREFMESGDVIDAQLKLAVSDVEANDPQVAQGDLPEVIRVGDINVGSLAAFTDLFHADLRKANSEALGENISLVRLLAIHGFGKEGEEVSWEVLAEMESDGDRHTKLEEPIIARLPFSAF